MTSFKSKNRIALMAIVSLAALLTSASLALAYPNAGRGGNGGGGGNPGGGDPPPTLDLGWIYSNGDPGGSPTVSRTSPDGATHQALPGAPVDYGCSTSPCGGSVGRPSHDTHDGSRWYVAHSFFGGPDNRFPNAGSSGMHGLDIDIIREGSATGITVLDASATCIWVGAYPIFTGDASGADTAISWPGAQWQDLDGDPNGDCESFVAAGIFRADLIYSGGAIVGMQAPVLAVEVPLASGNVPDVRPGFNHGFAWSPDASQVAYVSENGPDQGGVYVASVGSAPADRVQVAEGNLFTVSWSPDQDAATPGFQTTLAISGWNTTGKVKGGVWTVQPDGSALTLVSEATLGRKSSDPDHSFVEAHWSPAGTHIVFIDHETVNWSSTDALRRITADGGDNTLILEESASVDIYGILGWVNPD